MGSVDGYATEQPVHRVSIKTFAMGKTEITQAQWQAVMGTNYSTFSQCNGECPKVKVSWKEAQDFILGGLKSEVQHLIA